MRRAALILTLAVTPVLWSIAASRADDLPLQATQRVAASVNQDAITIHDLESRVRMGLLSANLPDVAENRQRLAPEVLRRLIDEHLETQEATRLKIEVPEAEINGGIADLEHQNKMGKGQLAEFLEQHDVDPQSLRDQIRAQSAWVRVVRQQLLPEIRIGDPEIDSRLTEMKAGIAQPAYLAADIYLPVDDPKREGEVHDLADKLVGQIAQGAPFGALARQFSRTGAAASGDLGWITHGMIDDQLYDQLAKLEVGKASAPIRTRDGYHLLLLRDRHEAGQAMAAESTFDMAEVDLTALPSSSDDERKQVLASFRHAIEKDKACDDYERHTRNIVTAHFSRLGLIHASETPADVQPIIGKLQKGEISEPIKLDNDYRFFIACNRSDSENGLPTREDVRRRIENERLDLLSNRYLRDLRRAAFVEIRI